MRACFQIVACASALLMVGGLAGAEVETSSETWSEIYQPPYKVPTELQKGSELRAGLFDALRRKVGKECLFAGSLKAYRNWAFFSGRTVDASGNPVTHPPHDNDDAVALWVRTCDGWKLVDYSFGHSDVFYVIWPEQYGLPKALLGME